MDWKLRDKVSVFLSSTFRDLQPERKAVEAVITRMSEHYVGMEHWGSFDDAPLEKSLDEVRKSDVGLLVLGDRYGFVPVGSDKSITELEYRTLIEERIPVLPYFGSQDSEDDVQLRNLKDEIRHAHGVSWFRSPDHLASMVAADLARQVRTLIVDSLPFIQEVCPALMQRHDSVNVALANGNWARARELSDEVLRDHPCSPRAHYNKACALSRLAEQSPEEERRSLLDDAQKAFESAMEHGMVHLVALYLHTADPLGTIREEPDLQYLYDKRKGVVTQYLGPDRRPRIAGFGAHGCVAANMPVHLSGGGFKAVGDLLPGDSVTSWDPQNGSAVAATVDAARHTTAAEVLRINGSIEVTSAHPILTDSGWLPAGELDGDTQLQLASGRFEPVRSVEIVPERRSVVDLAVTPTQAFIVAGVVVHNKYPPDLLDGRF